MAAALSLIVLAALVVINSIQMRGMRDTPSEQGEGTHMTTPLWKRVIVYILEGLLALVFISPLIWVVVCSFSPQPGSAQSKAGV